MSHSVNVSPEARAKDAAFLQERAASGKEKYIVRHSKQARLTMASRSSRASCLPSRA